VGCGKPKWLHSVIRKWADDKRNASVEKRINKHLPLNSHMNEDVFVQYLKEHLLKGKQTLACVSDPPNKLTIRGKIKLLGF